MAERTYTKNYVLGKGELRIARYPANSKVEPAAARALGNAPEFSYTQASTQLDHYSSEAGVGELDESVVTRVDFTGKFVVDHLSNENMALWLLGTATLDEQADTTGDAATVEVFASVTADRFYQIGRTTNSPMGIRGIDPATFAITVENAGFNEVTAATAAAAGAGLTNGTRTFTITDGTGTVAAVLSATVTAGAIAGAITVVEGGRYSVNPDITGNATATVDSGVLGGATFDLTMGALADSTVLAADYDLNDETGALYLMPAPTSFATGDTLNVSYKTVAHTRKIIKAQGNTIYGALFFEAHNPVGVNRHVYIPYAQITSDGDFAMIGEAWQQASFTFKALKRDATTEKLYADGVAVVGSAE